MKKAILYILLFKAIILNYNIVYSQKEPKEIIVEGEFQSEVYDIETKDAAKKRVKEGAIVNALEKAFGVAVFQGNSLYVENKTNGNKTETKTGFNSIADTYVKGEVVEELSEKFTEIPFEKKKKGRKTEHGIEYKYEVKIKAREYIEPKAEFNAFPLFCIDTLTCKTTSFKKDEDFYLFFKSPKSGYLSIFLDDNQNSSVLLPYSEYREKFQQGFPIEANKEYIFFKNDKKYFNPATMIVDEFTWETKENLEKINIIFSTKPLELPDLNRSTAKELPKNLPSVDFNKWLIKLRKTSKTIELMKIPISTVFR
jgi:hypothetical protein